MKLDTRREDPNINKLEVAYHKGASIISKEGNPCSICRMFTKKSMRKHFHASDLGVCQRKLYLDCVYGKDEPENHAFLNDGHLHEHSILSSLERGGLIIKAARNQEEKIVPVSIIEREGLQYQFVLHFDGIWQTNDDDRFGLECKAVADTRWNHIRKEGDISDVWYGQIQSYMHYFKMPLYYLIVKRRENADVRIFGIEYDAKYLGKRFTKLKEIYLAMTDNADDDAIPKEHENIRDDECRLCPYQMRCYGKTIPLIEPMKGTEYE